MGSMHQDLLPYVIPALIAGAFIGFFLGYAVRASISRRRPKGDDETRIPLRFLHKIPGRSLGRYVVNIHFLDNVSFDTQVGVQGLLAGRGAKR